MLLASLGAAAYAQDKNTNLLGTNAGISFEKGKPQTLNGEKIYNSHSMTATGPAYRNKDTSLHFYILSSLKNEFNALPDGVYNFYLNDIVVDKDGKIVYCSYDGVEMAASNKHKVAVPQDVQTNIQNKLREVITNMPPLVAAHKEGKFVPYVVKGIPPASSIQVKNHSVRIF
jgi:hypothetical protein